MQYLILSSLFYPFLVSVALYSLIGKYEMVDAFRSLITVVEENPTSLAQIELISSRSVTSEIKAKAGKTLKLLYFKNHRKYKLRFHRNPSFDGWVHFRKSTSLAFKMLSILMVL
jgi:hypothetical protein